MVVRSHPLELRQQPVTDIRARKPVEAIATLRSPVEQDPAQKIKAPQQYIVLGKNGNIAPVKVARKLALRLAGHFHRNIHRQAQDIAPNGLAPHLAAQRSGTCRPAGRGIYRSPWHTGRWLVVPLVPIGSLVTLPEQFKAIVVSSPIHSRAQLNAPPAFHRQSPKQRTGSLKLVGVGGRVEGIGPKIL